MPDSPKQGRVRANPAHAAIRNHVHSCHGLPSMTAFVEQATKPLRCTAFNFVKEPPRKAVYSVSQVPPYAALSSSFTQPACGTRRHVSVTQWGEHRKHIGTPAHPAAAAAVRLCVGGNVVLHPAERQARAPALATPTTHATTTTTSQRLAAIANAQASQSLTGAVRSGYSTQSTLCNYLAQAAVER